jgi:glycerol-3-phosphate cytidylyltransferase-like family protein
LQKGTYDFFRPGHIAFLQPSHNVAPWEDDNLVDKILEGKKLGYRTFYKP